MQISKKENIYKSGTHSCDIEDELPYEDFDESSSCHSVVNKSMIIHLISSRQLLEYFEKREPRNPISKERITSHRLFRTIQGWIENEFFDSLDIAI